jgi:hypothetical protein
MASYNHTVTDPTIWRICEKNGMVRSAAVENSNVAGKLITPTEYRNTIFPQYALPDS